MSFVDNMARVPSTACETVSGRYVDIVNPDQNSIALSDIGWSLSRQARFAGHTLSEDVWNVAQHSCFVESLIRLALDEDWKGVQLHESMELWLKSKGFTEDHTTLVCKNRLAIGALMHDAPEAYLVDLPSPVKRYEPLREPYKQLENGVKLAIHEALKLPELKPIEEVIVVWADLLALQIEAANLMPSRGRGWSEALPKMNVIDVSLFPTQVKPWKLAYFEFMDRANELGLS